MKRKPSQRPDPLRIVAIGGGTGLSTLLSGLKAHGDAVDITAIVTVTDDGGSSGRLRREFDILPPGDIRNCMVALSEDEALLSKLFQHRFAAGRGLKGHSFGNLFLAALTHLTGDFAQAVKVSSEVLAIAGRIFPSTSSNVTIEADLADGTAVAGETKISRARTPIDRIRLNPAAAKPLPEALEAIAQADLITFGPGSLFTSVIPNLLVDGIPRAIRRSRARTAYFVNLMWQPWETMHFSAADHILALERHAGPRLLDWVIVNTHPISGARRRRYAAEQVFPVDNDLLLLGRRSFRVLGRNLLAKSEKVRHDPTLIAAVAMELAAQSRDERLQRKARSRTMNG